MPTDLLDFYARPGALTSLGGPPSLAALPSDPAALVRVVQGLLLHEQWAPAYGVELAADRRRESHIRSAAQMLLAILARDDRPLSEPRPVGTRVVGVCRHFTVLLAALLRAKGIPARARCGFGTYFAPGRFEDHWVCEYWSAAEARWFLVDAQLDALQRARLEVDFDPLDVPRDRFLVAGDAWAQCRAGAADPGAFGIFALRGLWFVAGNVVRDLAALNRMELLPWDLWGAMPSPDEPVRDDQLPLIDELAALTRAPDTAFSRLRAVYEADERWRAPATVFNNLLQRVETI